MIAVAIGALGGLVVAQFGQCPVQTQGITAGKVGVAIAAAVGHLLAIGQGIGVGQVVSLVAVGATRPASALAGQGVPGAFRFAGLPGPRRRHGRWLAAAPQ